MIDLSLIIVSYNTSALTCDCLASVMAAEAGERELFVVDNASTDDSVVKIREGFPSVHLIANHENLGFAAANNQAIPLCRGRYLLFLNPDTRVTPNLFTRALSFMDDNPQIGLAGPRIVNPDGTPQESVSFRYPGQRHSSGELDGLPGGIACVLGAAMIARTGLIRQIGGFDEGFFLYGEDQDLALRVRKAGLEIGFIPDAVVVHLGAQSERHSAPEAVRERKLRAEYLFYDRHYRPQTVQRIRRLQQLQAVWRIATLRAASWLPWGSDRTQEKLRRYRPVLDFLRRIPSPSEPGHPGRDRKG